MTQDIVIGGRLHSAATGNTVAGANEILDDAKGKKQNVINQEVDNEIGSDSAAGTIKGRIKNLETAVGSGGSVDERIAETKAEIIGDATADYNTLGKVEDKIQAETSRAEGAEGALDAAKANKAITLEGYGITDAYTKSETYNKTEVNGLVDTPHQNYVTVLTYAALIAIDPGSTDTIYRVSNYDGSVPQVDVTKYSEYAWDGTQYVFLCVKSQIDEVFDISVYNNNATYADLAAALGTDGANVPQTLRRGGMSVKFVHSVDNKYVQRRLMSDEWSTDINNWAIAEEGVYVENPEFVYVKTDKEGKILWAIRTDGSIYYGAGVPQQVKEYVEEKISSLSLDEYEDIVAFLSDYLGSDTTLKAMIDGINAQIVTKVDKVEGKSLIDAEFAEGVSQVENPEFTEIHTDAYDKILYGVKQDGDFYFGAGIPSQIQEKLDNKVDKEEGNSLINTDYASSQSAIDNPEYLQITTDSEDKILEGITSEGVKHINLPIDTPSILVEHIENPEWSEIKTDNKQNIIEGVKKNGSKHVSQFDKETLIKLTEDLTPLLNYRKIYPHNAIVSFIDDDTGVYIPDIWGEIIEETDIKMGFACITGFMSGEITPSSTPYIQLPLADLRTLYNNGHEVYSHSWSHPSFRVSSLDEIEEECQKSKDWLDANGFTRNSDIIVYPGGMGEKKIDEQTVIRRFYHYGVDTDTSDFGVNPEPVNEQCICRCNGDSLSLAELKARVDLAVERKHLLVIMCHAYELMHFEGVTPPSTSIGTKEQNIQRLIDLINYIKSLNIEILPVGEALHQIYGW